MNYIELPRELYFRDRQDIEEYSIDNEKTLEHLFLEKLLNRPFMMCAEDAPTYALSIFNNAYYLCSIVLRDPVPKLYLGQYMAIASNNHKDTLWENHIMPATMALLYNLLRVYCGYDQGNSFMKLLWENFLNWDVKGAAEGKEDFYSLIISSNDFSTTEDFDRFEERSMIDLLSDKSISNSFIIKNIDSIISIMFGMADEGIALPLLKEKIEGVEPLIDDKTFSTLIETLKDAYKHTTLEWTEPKKPTVFFIAGEEDMAEGNTLPVENSEKIEELNRELEYYKTLYEAANKQLERYNEELSTVEELTMSEKFNITERVIFFHSLLGCSLTEINQVQMAKFIERLTGDKWGSIRATISDINSQIKKVEEEESKEFSKGVSSAALNVYKFIHAAVNGSTIGAKPFQCKQAMENIKNTYNLKVESTDNQPTGDFLLTAEED